MGSKGQRAVLPRVGTRRWHRLVGAAAMVFAGWLLVSAGDLPAWPLTAVLSWLLLLAGAFVMAVAYRRAGESCWREMVLLAAIVRLPFLALAPSLSEDVWRYLWEGRVVRAGGDPYRTAPSSPRLDHLRSGVWAEVASRVGHGEIPSVYPPAAMAAFVAAAGGERPLWRYKLLVFVSDVLACFALGALARRLARPAWLVALYAFNPLVLIEGTGMGHVDALGVLPLVLAAVWALRPSAATAAASGMAWAVAVLIKLVPLVALPALLRHGGRRRVLAAAALAALLVGMAPMFVSAGGVPPGLIRYGISWEWNGPLFEPLWRVIDALSIAPAIKVVLGWMESLAGEQDALEGVYPYVYPQLLAKGALLALMPFVLRWALRGADLGVALHRALTGSLLLLATVHPWYVLWALPFAALERSWPWLVLSITGCFSYLPLFRGRSLSDTASGAASDLAVFPVVYLMVWCPPLMVWGWQRAQRRVRRS